MNHPENIAGNAGKQKSLIIDGWRSGIRFSACHMIPYHRKCSRLHGHTYVLHLKILGYPDKSGFLMDFSSIKQELRKIANVLDHKILLPSYNLDLNILKEGKNIRVDVNDKNYLFPEDDVVILDITTCTAEILSDYLLEEFEKNVDIPVNIKSVSLGVDEGPGQGAWSEKTY